MCVQESLDFWGKHLQFSDTQQSGGVTPLTLKGLQPDEETEPPSSKGTQVMEMAGSRCPFRLCLAPCASCHGIISSQLEPACSCDGRRWLGTCPCRLSPERTWAVPHQRGELHEADRPHGRGPQPEEVAGQGQGLPTPLSQKPVFLSSSCP